MHNLGNGRRAIAVSPNTLAAQSPSSLTMVRPAEHGMFLSALTPRTAGGYLFALKTSLLQDVYSFAVVLWEMMTFEIPWGNEITPWQVGLLACA
jgi:hypothetical protein